MFVEKLYRCLDTNLGSNIFNQWVGKMPEAWKNLAGKLQCKKVNKNMYNNLKFTKPIFLFLFCSRKKY